MTPFRSPGGAARSKEKKDPRGMPFHLANEADERQATEDGRRGRERAARRDRENMSSCMKTLAPGMDPLEQLAQDLTVRLRKMSKNARSPTIAALSRRGDRRQPPFKVHG